MWCFGGTCVRPRHHSPPAQQVLLLLLFINHFARRACVNNRLPSHVYIIVARSLKSFWSITNFSRFLPLPRSLFFLTVHFSRTCVRHHVLGLRIMLEKRTKYIRTTKYRYRARIATDFLWRCFEASHIVENLTVCAFLKI